MKVSRLLTLAGFAFALFATASAQLPSPDSAGLHAVAMETGSSESQFAFANAGTPFCFGDGSGAACPCGNFGAAGEGCANSGGLGCTLVALGHASFSADSLTFQASGAPAGKLCALVRGDSRHLGGLGSPLASGLRCISGNIAFSQIIFTDAFGNASFLDWHGGPMGSAANPPGMETTFQFWYKDQGGNPCGKVINTSNAWGVTYRP